MVALFNRTGFPPFKNEWSALFRRLLANHKVQIVLAIVWTLAVLEASIAIAMAVPGFRRVLPTTLQHALSQLYSERVAHHISLLPECAQYDPVTFYTMKASASCRFANIEFDTSYAINSAGLRDAESDLKTPEIIALGDSYTMGAGVEATESFVNQLETLIGRKILNAGISSFGTEREFRILQRLDTSNVKVVILQYSDNDLGENLAAVSPSGFNIRSAKDYKRISAKHVRKTKYLPFKLSFYLVRDILIKGYLRKLGHRDDAVSQHRKEVAAFVKIFGKIREVVPTARFIITELSGRGRARREFVAALEKHFSGDGSITVVAVEPDLPDEAFFTLDGHINKFGHLLVAERIAPFVRHERGGRQ